MAVQECPKPQETTASAGVFFYDSGRKPVGCDAVVNARWLVPLVRGRGRANRKWPSGCPRRAVAVPPRRQSRGVAASQVQQHGKDGTMPLNNSCLSLARIAGS